MVKVYDRIISSEGTIERKWERDGVKRTVVDNGGCRVCAEKV